MTATERPQDRNRRLNKIGGLVVTSILAGGVVVLAVRAEGYDSTKAHLHDAGIWISSESSIGRYNTDLFLVDTKSAAMPAVGSLQQNEGTVVFEAGGRLFTYDVAKNKPLIPEGVEFPEGASISLGGPNGALLDSHKVWFTNRDAAGAVIVTGPRETPGSIELRNASQVVVGADGRAHVLAETTGALWTLDVPTVVGGAHGVDIGAGGPGAQPTDTTAPVVTQPATTAPATEVPVPVPTQLDGPLTEPQLSAYGRRAVVLDPSARRLVLETGSVLELPEWLGGGASLRLFRASADGGQILVAGSGGLGLVPVSGGEVQQLDGSGGLDAIAPVWLDGCAYGAWADRFVRLCPDRPERNRVAVPSAAPSAFRVNRGRVVLNNEDGSGAFFDEDVIPFDHQWKDALQPQKRTETKPSTDPKENDCSVAKPTNKAPVAVDDEYTVRGGQTAILDVISGVGSGGSPDHDDDCDVITVTQLEPADLAGLSIIRHGRALQFTAPAEATTLNVTYTLSDGLETDQAEVVITVLDPNDATNNPPVAADDVTTVAVGKTVVMDVLANDTDPESDPIFLTDATAANPDDAAGVSWQPNGRVSFTAGSKLGEVTVTYKVTDGIADDQHQFVESTATLKIDVVPLEKNLPPNTLDDVTEGIVDQTMRVNVLANDSDPNGDALRVVGVFSNDDAGQPVSGVLFDNSGYLEFVASKPGAYSFIYRVSDGQPEGEAVGRVRFDVSDVGNSHPPVAVRDDVVLEVGRPAYVEPLQNDSDVDGDLLAVVAVTPSSAAVAALHLEVIDQRLVRITTGDVTQPGERYTFTYLVSDGTNNSIGTVNVSIVAPQGAHPPIATADTAEVHAGGAVSIPVLANDSDPDGDVLKIVGEPKIDAAEGPDSGRLFVQGNQLRYIAPETGFPNTISGEYTITDGRDRSTGRITISITDPAVNRPPNPPPIDVRVFAGTGDAALDAVVIELPAAQVDPDGDAVSITGIRDLPGKGVATTDGARLVYVPSGPQAGQLVTGQDTFSYEVVDSLGKSGFGQVRIVVTARPPNSAPIAVDDEATALPSGVLSLPVLANDIDNDGDVVSLLDVGPVTTDGGTVDPLRAGDGRITYHAPATEGEYSFTYRITDGKANSLAAQVVVRVTSEISNLPPQVGDDVVAPVRAGDSFTIDVLANDRDPEGEPPTLVVTPAMRRLGVKVTEVDGRQQLTGTMPGNSLNFDYAVSDGVSTAYGLVRVPLAPSDSSPTFSVGTIVIGKDDPVDTIVDVADYFDGTDADGQRVDVYHETQPAVLYGGGLSPGATLRWASPDGTTFTFTRNLDYSGEVMVSYVITDGTHVVVAQVRLRIESQTNSPPIASTDVIEIEAGSAARSIDLKGTGLVSDPDPGDIVKVTFADAAASDDRLAASVNEAGRLTLGVADATVGQDKSPEVAVTLTADDHKNGGSATLTLHVLVVANRSAPPNAVDDTFTDLQPGQGPQRLPVMRNDTPGALPGSTTVVVAAGAADHGTVLLDSNPDTGVYATTVLYEPAADFYGDAHFSYTISDLPEGSMRQSTAFVTVSVRNTPERPDAPTPADRLSTRAVVSFRAPLDRGAPIDIYTVESTPAAPGGNTTCVASPCTIEGLTNGQEYTFRVKAHNVVGDSEWSAFSAPYTPDELPGQPSPPVVDWNDRTLHVAWGATPNAGGAVQTVTLVVSPTPPGGAPGAIADVGGKGGSKDIPVTNGVAYRVTVFAHNTLGDGPPSGTSLLVTPVGPPTAKGVPALSRGDGLMTITLPADPADANGDPHGITYTVELLDQATQSVVGSGSAEPGAPIQLPAVNGTTYQARYRVANAYTQRFATGEAVSSSSPGQRACGLPRSPAAPTVVAQGVGDNSVRVHVTAPDFAGCELTKMQVSANNGPWVDVAAATGDYTIPAANGDIGFTFRSHGVNEVGTGNDSGPSSPAVKPYGHPAAPVVTGTLVGYQQVRWTYTTGAINGPSGLSQTAGVASGTVENLGPGAHSMTITVCNAGSGGVANQGCTSGVGSITVPNPRVWTTPGATYGSATGSCAANACEYMIVHVEGLAPSTNYAVTCFRNTQYERPGGTVSTDGIGNGIKQTLCVAGTPADASVTVNGIDGDGAGSIW